MLTPEDKSALETAVQLVNAVLDRHHLDIDTTSVSLLCSAAHNIEIAGKYIGYHTEEKSNARV